MQEPAISIRALNAMIETMKTLPVTPVTAEGLAWLRWQRTVLAAPSRQHLVFYIDPPGYVTLGLQGGEMPLENPGLAGLDYAWQILLVGVGAQHTLHADTLLDNPGRRPANALRNALSAAADWVEYVALCPLLAVAIRGISVANDGTIHCNPANGPRITLMPF